MTPIPSENGSGFSRTIFKLQPQLCTRSAVSANIKVIPHSTAKAGLQANAKHQPNLEALDTGAAAGSELINAAGGKIVAASD